MELCIDCTLAIAGYDSHELGRMLPLAVTEFAASAGLSVSRNDDPDPHFSWSPCDGCGSDLGGDRYKHTRYVSPAKARLGELRTALRSESISYGELAELAGISHEIDPSDVELLEAAGVPESN